ncbi:MAG: hypothetical protein ACOX27_02490 [Caldicoprobacterales bacterium]|nr:hypothetical protein [Clostridiales bacterium]
MDKENILTMLAKLREFQSGVQNVHQLFSFSYPITIVKDDLFHIYDVTLNGNEYKLIKTEPCHFPIPHGVRAAFPLERYGDKISAIITEEVFDTLDGFITILHEFVHCAQYNQCEMELRKQLAISEYYRKENNYMWEITHPFPYDDQTFIGLFEQYISALDDFDISRAEMIRTRLSTELKKADFEYLAWQEWKEGFARFIENKIKARLNVETNHKGREKPYNRISFYESGSKYISLIDRENEDIIADIKGLFFEMNKDVLTLDIKCGYSIK